MTVATLSQPNPTLDLVLERIVAAPPARVWRAWTDPDQIKQWFTPAPWMTIACEIDLRPGGQFRFVQRSPEGEEHAMTLCYLEVVPNERLVWTLALEPGFRPASTQSDIPLFTAVITLEPHGSGTKYTTVAMHATSEGRDRHNEMGFHDGWGTALDQLVALVTAA